MEHHEVSDLVEQDLDDSIMKFECPNCGAEITSEADAHDLYCNECKMIVMQNSLTNLGFI